MREHFWHSELSEYSTVARLAQNGNIAAVDYFFAKSSRLSSSEEETLLLSFLMAASRLGHICVMISEDEVSPAILDKNAHDQIRKSVNIPLPSCVVQVSNRFYLKVNFDAEEKAIFQIKRLATESHDIEILNLPDIFNCEQKAAIRMALSSPISLITGGPGTGKTFTATGIANQFIKGQKNARIALTAPTGKATSKLSLGMNFDGEVSSVSKTLHSLLGVSSSRDLDEDPVPLPYDLIIVDECSMIDARLFTRLLSALSRETTCILLGDPHQLPPVESGLFFSDLIESKVVPSTHLNQCLRVEDLQLLEFAKAINKGVVELPKDQNRVSLKSLQGAPYEMPPFWAEAMNKLPTPFVSEINIAELLHRNENFRILTPLRRSIVGVDVLNRYFRDAFLKQAPSSGYFVEPIMITRNDTRSGLANGDCGILLHDLTKASSTFAVFPIQEEDGSWKRLPLSHLPKYVTSFVISVHKSQGSEYDEIALLLPDGSERFGRELLYTAVTRAKKRCTIYAENSTLLACVEPKSRRISGFSDAINS